MYAEGADNENRFYEKSGPSMAAVVVAWCHPLEVKDVKTWMLLCQYSWYRFSDWQASVSCSSTSFVRSVPALRDQS
jgi:hypothetical protein